MPNSASAAGRAQLARILLINPYMDVIIATSAAPDPADDDFRAGTRGDGRMRATAFFRPDPSWRCSHRTLLSAPDCGGQTLALVESWRKAAR
jgi:hypothetical protein